jgi:hypothetical protein
MWVITVARHNILMHGGVNAIALLDKQGLTAYVVHGDVGPRRPKRSDNDPRSDRRVMRQNGNYSVISVALFVISCKRIRSSLLWQIPISFQLSASTEIQGSVAFLPLVPVRLKYLKSKVVLPAPTTLGEHIRQRRLKPISALTARHHRSHRSWRNFRKRR